MSNPKPSNSGELDQRLEEIVRKSLYEAAVIGDVAEHISSQAEWNWETRDIPERVLPEALQALKEVCREEAANELTQLLGQLHGGGNWRRIITMRIVELKGDSIK